MRDLKLQSNLCKDLNPHSPFFFRTTRKRMNVKWFLLCLLFHVQPRDAGNTTSCPYSDQQLYIEKEYQVIEANLNTCGLQSLGSASNARTCLDSRSFLSQSCIECQVALIVCTGQNCAAQCADGGRTNPTCVQCVDVTSPCDSNFVTCSGFEFPK